MGRKKTLNKDELLNKAMEVFREHGFAGTSADMLVTRTGVSRYSLYSDFGSLQGLFDAALDRYNDAVIDLRFGPLERPEAGLDDIGDLLAFYGAASEGPASGRGCLLCNTAVEFGPDDATGRGVIQRYFKRVSGAFETALGNAKARGELQDGVDPRKEADLLTSVVLGLFVMIRAKAPASTLEHSSALAMERIDGLRTGPR